MESSPTTVAQPHYEERVLRKVARKLIPFIALAYAVNILDRTNISIAALQMKTTLPWYSDYVHGLGAGMFFIGYFFFEVPSNLILDRVGARRWIARIMISWGIVSASMMYVSSPLGFYSMRFLLGLAEAGFYPGIILYLTYWFPAVVRAKAVARFVAISALVGIIGSPLSGLLLQLNGVMGLKGWQWVFVLEGLPSCLLGFVVLMAMTDRPENATWLAGDEREWLVDRLNREKAHRQLHHGFTLRQAFTDIRVIHFCALFFLIVGAGYGLGFFIPKIMKAQTGWSDMKVSVVSALPGIAGAIAMLVGAAHSDRSFERRGHVAFGALVAGLGIFGIAYAAGTPFAMLTLAAMVINSVGGQSLQGPFWAMPTSLLTGSAAAGAIALINSVGNLGGFAGPFLMGRLKESTGGYTWGLCVLAAMLMGAAVLAMAVPHDPVAERSASESRDTVAAA